MKQPKTILVTGAHGQLGSSLFELADTKKEFKWIFTDVEQFDITNPEQVNQVIGSLRPFAVINTAAYTAVDKAESEKELVRAVNVTGPAYLAAACAEYDVMLVHISTDYVFGGNENTPYLEDSSRSPEGVYAATKARGELEVITSGCSYYIIRTSWLYSEYGSNFVKTMLKLLKDNKEVRVVNDQTGSPTYAGDLARAIIDLLLHTSTKIGTEEVFHYANQGQITWYEFAQEIARLKETNCQVLPITSDEFQQAAKRPRYSVLDTEKIRKKIGIEIPHWKVSLAICVQNLLSGKF